MYPSQSKALGLINSLKIVQKPNSSDFINIHLKFDSLASNLPGYFDSMEPSDPTDVKPKEFTMTKRPGQKFILVLGLISNVLGTKIYMHKILEDDNIKPKYALKFIGQQSDVIIINWIAYYLHTMENNLWENMKRFRPHNMNAMHWQKMQADSLYNNLIAMFQPDSSIHNTRFLSFHLGRLYNLQIRNDKVFDYCLNNLKFTYSNNNIYRYTQRYKKLPPIVYTKGGVFKVKTLIGMI